MKTVELFYDFSSPNAHFAAFQLPAIAKRHGATVVYRPFFLGGLFKLLDGPQTPGMLSPEKARHSQEDLARWSKKHGIEFRFPSRFPMNTVRPLRVALGLTQDGVDTRPFTEAVFGAYWVDDQDLADRDVIARILDGLGADTQRLLEYAESQPAKDALRQATEAARARGVFGAPAMIVGQDLFFGKDRLDFVEDALRGP